VNYFSRYEILKHQFKQLAFKDEYDRICDNLETLRREFRLPANFKYSKIKRRDNPFFKGGVEVILPDDVKYRPSTETELSSDSGNTDSTEDSTQPKEED
jgi:hypothetical protein